MMSGGDVLTEEETEVYLLLRKYQVRSHYLASSSASAVRYAVFANGAQITAPTSHAEAKSDSDRLTAKDIVKALLASRRAKGE